METRQHTEQLQSDSSLAYLPSASGSMTGLPGLQLLPKGHSDSWNCMLQASTTWCNFMMWFLFPLKLLPPSFNSLPAHAGRSFPNRFSEPVLSPQAHGQQKARTWTLISRSIWEFRWRPPMRIHFCTFPRSSLTSGIPFSSKPAVFSALLSDVQMIIYICLSLFSIRTEKSFSIHWREAPKWQC